jgi:phosphoserine phosphatase
MSEDAIAIMADFLQDIPVDELAAVLRELVRESRFMPLVADIVAKHKAMSNEPVEVEAAWMS